jgi:hypothetical protein
MWVIRLSRMRERVRALGYVVDGPAEKPSPSADTERERP